MKTVVAGGEYNLNKVVEDLGDNYFLVKCTGCGLERRVWKYNVLRGVGCRKCSQRNFEAPVTIDGRQTKEYTAWASMVARCQVSMPSWKERFSETRYPGLEVEPSWLGPDGYTEFYKAVGPAFEGAVLDRTDNDKGYVVGNVKWVTVQQSNVNKSNTHWVTAFGLTKTLQEWADDLGISSTGLNLRLKAGYSPEDAVSVRPQGIRSSSDEYFMSIAVRIAGRSTCSRRAVGCVLTDARRHVQSTGYNGVPPGLPHCHGGAKCAGSMAKSGEGLDLCMSSHAEQSALLQCKDVYTIDAAYVTASPCMTCTKLLLNTSCKRIVYLEEYPHTEARDLWLRSGREWIKLDFKYTVTGFDML